MFSLKNVLKKPLVLLCFRSKMLKNHWFYKQRGLKTKKTIGFTVKPVPATDSGRGFHILVWKCYEEPLQTSCLGKYSRGLKTKKPLVLHCSLCK